MDNMNALREFASNAMLEVEHWKGMLAIVLKQSGGTFVVKKSESDVDVPYEIVMRRVDEEGSPDSAELEVRLLEGQDEIEKVLGKPSPIIIPK